MDLSILMTELSRDDRALLLSLLNRGASTASRDERYRANMLVQRITDAARDAPHIDRYHARILLCLFITPRGMELVGVNPAVLELLREQGRIVPDDGTRGPWTRWHITRSGARLLYRTGHADEEIADAQLGHVAEALLAS